MARHDRRTPHERRIRGLAGATLGAGGPQPRRHRSGDRLKRGAARDRRVQIPLRRSLRLHGAGHRRARGGAGHRRQRAPARRGGSRSAGQHGRRPYQPFRRTDRPRLRHRDHLRLGECRGRLRRRNHCSRHRAFAGGTASGGRTAAAYRRQAPRESDCPGDGAGHAIRHLLGLCGAYRGYRRAHEGGDRCARDDDCDRGAGRPLRRRHIRHRRGRSGPDDPGSPRGPPRNREKQ